MKKIIIFLVLTLGIIACKKEKENNYGCVYGVSKTNGQRTYIRCGDHDIFMAGSNQAAADKIAADKNIPKENVTVMVAFTNWEFVRSSNCNCN
jgi:hypothetical protein